MPEATTGGRAEGLCSASPTNDPRETANRAAPEDPSPADKADLGVAFSTRDGTGIVSSGPVWAGVSEPTVAMGLSGLIAGAMNVPVGGSVVCAGSG